MQKPLLAIASLLLLAGAFTLAKAHVASEELPAGPLRDRHELMEGIGKNAKIIGDALKSGDLSPVGDAAAKIQTSAAKIIPLFPKGSTDPLSRAKPEIWEHWDTFQKNAKDLEARAGLVASAAQSGGNVKAAAHDMFGACKSCHDEFRKPEKKK